MTILEIDGSFGEGGGQTLRIAASFSIIFGRPIRVTRVRAGRKVPGLRPQHAATLKILHEICGGTLSGAEVGSTEFTFAPGLLLLAGATIGHLARLAVEAQTAPTANRAHQDDERFIYVSVLIPALSDRQAVREVPRQAARRGGV